MPTGAGTSKARCGVLFRAAGNEAPSDAVLATIKRLFDLESLDTLRYADRKKGQRRAVRLSRIGEHAELQGFALASDTSAQAWIKTLLQDELPAQA